MLVHFEDYSSFVGTDFYPIFAACLGRGGGGGGCYFQEVVNALYLPSVCDYRIRCYGAEQSNVTNKLSKLKVTWLKQVKNPTGRTQRAGYITGMAKKLQLGLLWDNSS